ncbi:MAG TPA: NAD(P)/FAD-dependent oxidoreductase [Candidatus Limnocylindrales bacterium]|nr:NAD(P)/FAD-dependent oxidoreductase [Candidatus Limnocylindrales bacterium]
MQRSDVLVVGGGPAGSSCAWALRRKGLDVRVLDRARFPRHKVCAGWITPGLVDALELDLDDYGRGRTLQPIRGFRTGVIGGRDVETSYARPVSYGILRSEFDAYLLRRSAAPVTEGTGVTRLRREGGEWVLNETFRAPLLVGAGGHFCPVARRLGARRAGDGVVAAQEVEFRMDARQRGHCAVAPEVPELYFCADLKGYGWVFRKDDVLNVGFGRADAQEFPRQARAFAEYLAARGRVPAGVPPRWLGHAYLLYDAARPRLVDDGVLLVGDAAGLAYAQSGEGIRPAVESGLMAAAAIEAAAGDYGRERLGAYRERLLERFGPSRRWSVPVPAGLLAALGRRLLATRWFTRRVVIEDWFLHARQPPLPAADRTPSLLEPAAS